jgi:hypothetical protein
MLHPRCDGGGVGLCLGLEIVAGASTVVDEPDHCDLDFFLAIRTDKFLPVGDLLMDIAQCGGNEEPYTW